jgi:hypothetical protein
MSAKPRNDGNEVDEPNLGDSLSDLTRNKGNASSTAWLAASETDTLLGFEASKNWCIRTTARKCE